MSDVDASSDSSAEEAHAAGAVTLSHAGDASAGAERRGLILLTADYGYAVPEQERARRALALARRRLPPGWAHELRLGADAPESEIKRYGDPPSFPALFVCAPPLLLRYGGALRADDMLAALRLAAGPALPRAPEPRGMRVLGRVKPQRAPPERVRDLAPIECGGDGNAIDAPRD